MITISTEWYRKAHGKAPEGHGHWAFRVMSDGPNLDQPVISMPGPYTVVRAHVLRITRQSFGDDVTLNLLP